MLRDIIIAAVRTGVAAAIGIAITWLLNMGIEVPEDFAQSLNLVLFGLVVAGYNLAVSFLERKVHPYFGILLGIPKAPAYGSVGTQTPPPRDPVLGNPPVDRGAASLSVLGIVIAIIGLLLFALTSYPELGLVLLIVGVIVGVFGASREGRF